MEQQTQVLCLTQLDYALCSVWHSVLFNSVSVVDEHRTFPATQVVYALLDVVFWKINGFGNTNEITNYKQYPQDGFTHKC